MKNININFGNVLSELESKNLTLFFRKNIYGEVKGMFIEDSQGYVYQIEDYRYGSYLDKLIKEKIIVKFKQVDSNIIKEWEKEVWSISSVRDFVKRQKLQLSI